MGIPEKVITENTWILYKTINLINGKIYVGVHKVADTSTSKRYLGSGDKLKIAIKKYGRENFVRETLAEFSSCDDVYTAEAQIVTEEFIKREDTYNISLGGRGGVNLTEEMRAKISKANTGRTHTPETKAKLSAANKGKSHSEEARKKIGDASRGRKYYGRVLSEEHKAKIKASNTRPDNPRNKPVIINGKYYETAKYAAKIENIPHSTLWNRLKNPNPKWSEWRFAKDRLG
jgi:group I intron endonuclease